ncbi:MAG TPA: alkaline phosphatase family protein [Candidatus Baltobacteraceae bacterium]|nr:alkaline phosphatase family protein [Candidatus Baltobacteraceae bacterium]
MKRIAAAVISALFFSSSFGAAHAGTTAPAPADAAIIALARSRIKHVFVIYQENRSFDSYFGTFPGAENLASPLAQTHGFKQYDPLGKRYITPFRLTVADTSDVNHARPALIAKANGGAMDRFVAVEEQTALARGKTAHDAQRLGALTMAYEDCDTVPFLWKYASTFSLFDHFFQGMYGPSTPGNIDLIAAQTGQTQLARHPRQGVNPNDTGPGEPVVDDLSPFMGPYRGDRPEGSGAQLDQTYATLMLTLSGRDATNATADNDDVKDDIQTLASLGHPAIPWGWYQEGFGNATDPKSAYVTHHDAPQFFGYLRLNDYFWRGVHDLGDLLPALQNGTLGDRGVVFIKGGYHNPFGWKPADTTPAVQKTFTGDDDHPGYSDSHISEAAVATYVNAIARSKYWNDSVILILWDDSEGDYDHVPPPQFETCPDGQPCGDGPRIPAIVISPFSKSHAVVPSPADHASFAKFLGALFDLPALASLPDEAKYMPEGPRDTNPQLDDLMDAFDPARLSGATPPIPAAAAIIDESIVNSFPPKMSCASLGITPVAIPGSDRAPAGFTPLPTRDDI